MQKTPGDTGDSRRCQDGQVPSRAEGFGGRAQAMRTHAEPETSELHQQEQKAYYKSIVFFGH